VAAEGLQAGRGLKSESASGARCRSARRISPNIDAGAMARST
jgi:hypothetical protein